MRLPRTTVCPIDPVMDAVHPAIALVIMRFGFGGLKNEVYFFLESGEGLAVKFMQYAAGRLWRARQPSRVCVRRPNGALQH
jgi:hypothetical protein